MDYPDNFVLPTHISTASRYTNSAPRILADSTLTWASGAGVSNLQWFIPLVLPAPYLIASFFVCFGTSPGTSTFECGIFTSPTASNTYVNKIIGTASTACVNTSNNVQIVTPIGGSKLLSAGTYYMAYVSSFTNAIISRSVSSAGVIQSLKGSGVLLGPTAATLSSGTATQLSNTGTYRFPLFGISRLASGY